MQKRLGIGLEILLKMFKGWILLNYVPGQVISCLCDSGHDFPLFFGVGFVQALVLCFFPFVLQGPKYPHWLHPPSTWIGNYRIDLLFSNVICLCTWTRHIILVKPWTFFSSIPWHWAYTGSSPLFLSIRIARSKGFPLTPSSVDLR